MDVSTPTPKSEKNRVWPDFMIDVETLGTEPGCVVLSIGATFFDADAYGDVGQSWYRNLSPYAQVERGATIDPDTVFWWMRQSSEARSILTNAPRHDTKAALLDLFAHFDQFSSYEARVWAKSPTFDCVILKDLAKKFGLKLPWKFYSEEDVRGELRRAGVEALPVGGVAHNALDDCYAQVRDVQRARIVLNGLKKFAAQHDYAPDADLPVAEPAR